MNTHKGPGLGFRVAAAIVFALAVGLVASSQVSAQDETVTIGRTTVAAGPQVTLDLEALDIGAPGLSAWMINIAYNSSIVTATDCDTIAGGFCNRGFAAGIVRTTGATAGGLEGDRTLASITFTCLRAGNTALAVQLDEFADATVGDPQPIGADVVHGSISCLSPEPPLPAKDPGDVNDDGRVNSVDAALVLQYDADLINSLPNAESADVNDDGRINSVDAAIILQIDAGLL